MTPTSDAPRHTPSRGMSVAGLGADGRASNARMLVGSGHPSDNGACALELLRRDRDLQRAIGEG